MPQKVANAMDTNIILLSKNPDSLEVADSNVDISVNNLIDSYQMDLNLHLANK